MNSADLSESSPEFRMSFEYGPDSFNALVKVLRREDQASKPRWRRLVIKAANFSLLVVFVAAPLAMTAPSTPLNGLLTLYFFVAGCVTGIVGMLVTSASEQALLAVGAAHQKGQHVLTLSARGLDIASQTQSSTFLWGGIDRCETDASIAIIYLKAGTAFALPLKAFKERAQFDHFSDLVVRYANHGRPAVT